MKEFSKEKLSLAIDSGKAHAIGILSGGVVTEKCVVSVSRNGQNEFVRNGDEDVVKVAVVERHQGTGNV